MSATAGRVLLISGALPLGIHDAAISSRLTTLGYAVEVVRDTGAAWAHTTGKQIIVVCPSVAPHLLGAHLRDVAVPIVDLAPSLLPVLGMAGPVRGVDFGTAAALTDLAGGTDFTAYLRAGVASLRAGEGAP